MLHIAEVTEECIRCIQQNATIKTKHYMGSAEVLNLKILLLVWDIYMAVTAFVNLL
jgi:hypothetical protein